MARLPDDGRHPGRAYPVYQQGSPAFSTASDPTQPDRRYFRSWTTGRNDQTLEIGPCRPRYQGMNPSAGGDCSQQPRRLGLLTRTNSNC
ncbi:hypothetical protein [Actinophytocola oryzae]|uniref:hypothetical protein n=1 Tax=Actinophytocola oryzae TaxID=502181 RepID=UPI001AAE1DDB|nr:hypothetical protein [Actinophytocola oryzae]